MPESRKVYTAEFKVAAVNLVTQQGRSVAEAARSPGTATHHQDGAALST